jgi:hypothetical protein
MLEPSRTVIDDGIVVAMKSQQGSDVRRGLFAHSRRGWTLLSDGNEPSTGILTGRLTRTLGEVGLIADTTPPVVSRLTIREIRNRRVSVSFRVGDNFSGIEYQELKVYIDDTIVIPEIDGEHRRVTYQGTEQLDRGSHLLVIHIKDRLGNFSEVRREFNIR